MTDGRSVLHIRYGGRVIRTPMTDPEARKDQGAGPSSISDQGLLCAGTGSRGWLAISCVYSVCMARVNVYLPDELAQRARAAGVNISGVTQEAIRSALASLDTDTWLDRLARLPRNDIPHEQVISALDEARDELGA